MLGVGWFGACLRVAPKWYANIAFAPEGRIHRAPFHKATLVPYRSLHYSIHVCCKTYEKLLRVLPREGRAMLRAAFDALEMKTHTGRVLRRSACVFC